MLKLEKKQLQLCGIILDLTYPDNSLFKLGVGDWWFSNLEHWTTDPKVMYSNPTTATTGPLRKALYPHNVNVNICSVANATVSSHRPFIYRAINLSINPF